MSTIYYLIMVEVYFQVLLPTEVKGVFSKKEIVLGYDESEFRSNVSCIIDKRIEVKPEQFSCINFWRLLSQSLKQQQYFRFYTTSMTLFNSILKEANLQTLPTFSACLSATITKANNNNELSKLFEELNFKDEC